MLGGRRAGQACPRTRPHAFGRSASGQQKRVKRDATIPAVPRPYVALYHILAMFFKCGLWMMCEAGTRCAR